MGQVKPGVGEEALYADAFRMAADRGYDVIQLFGANLFRHEIFISFDSAWQYRAISCGMDHIIPPNKLARNPILFGAILFPAKTLNGYQSLGAIYGLGKSKRKFGWTMSILNGD
jgi:hypothetical protein